jgi:phenylpropionate dioxygenase-like ring-hydroxylating dioxygenase large terminal subunit
MVSSFVFDLAFDYFEAFWSLVQRYTCSMILNNWYVAAASDELSDAPLQTTMLGCDFVLFRDADRQIHCLSDTCCHRGASLSRGKCVSGCVQCPYHGWEFAGDGRVQRIPSLGEVKIPRKARVDSYPVQERYGLIWVFLGDAPPSQRYELPEMLPEYGDEQSWRITRMQRDWKVNWARLKENLADASHLYLVHGFGKHLPEQTQVFAVEETEWGIRVPQVYHVVPDKSSLTAANAPQAEQPRNKSEVTIEISVIGMIQKNTQFMASGYDQIIWNALTPIDNLHTRHYTLHFRNFQRGPQHDASMEKTIMWGLEEDAAVMDYLKPPLNPASNSNELLVATDGPEKAYRDKMRRLAAELGEIDWRSLRDRSEDNVLVIPSPARADGGDWVHQTVPLVTATG